MLPISESAEDFVSLLAFQHSHPSLPELCSAFLHFLSHSLSDVVLCSTLFVSFHNGVSGFLFSMSSLSTSREFLRHICQGMCLPWSPWTPSRPLHCLSLSRTKSLSLSFYCLQHDWVDSLNPKQASLLSMMGKHLSFPIVTTSLLR